MTVGESRWGFRVYLVFGCILVLVFLTRRTCEKIKVLDEYLTSYKIEFWRSVRNRSKQEHNKNTCDVKCFGVSFSFVLDFFKRC